ncbi:MAG: nuclear transport factor 2 family protein, partial [Saprospiraceae bacterium]
FTGSGFTGYRIFPDKNLSVILLTNGSMRQMPVNSFIDKLADIFTEEQTEQTDEELITSTIIDYIDGTAVAQPQRLIRAFHKDMNLYSIEADSLKVLSGKTYTSFYKPGQKRNRVGKIISIDFVNDAAIAKLEIDYPDRKTLYTDYLLLLKIKGRWKIIQKAYTSEKY